MRTLANSEDPDELPHQEAFHKSLHYLLIQKRTSEKELQFLFGNDRLWPLNIYNGPFKVYYVSNQNEESIRDERVN